MKIQRANCEVGLFYCPCAQDTYPRANLHVAPLKANLATSGQEYCAKGSKSTAEPKTNTLTLATFDIARFCSYSFDERKTFF